MSLTIIPPFPRSIAPRGGGDQGKGHPIGGYDDPGDYDCDFVHDLCWRLICSSALPPLLQADRIKKAINMTIAPAAIVSIR
jgi:hypothetical protein